MVNPILRVWLNYYGHFYPSALRQVWHLVNILFSGFGESSNDFLSDGQSGI